MANENKPQSKKSTRKAFEVEILFHTSSSPKRIRAVAVYTKDALLCIQTPGDLIIKYPLVNVFQVAHMHGSHCGSEVEAYTPSN